MKCNNRIPFLSASVSVFIATMALTACGPQEKKPGQSVARVDGHELTVNQLNGEIASLPPEVPKGEAAKAMALESMINRQLLLDEAEELKLDRDPEVMQAVMRQKEQVIIQALLQRKSSAMSKPTLEEVDSYYRANPALFANRKVYEMRQVVFPAEALTPAVKDLVDSGKSIDEITALLEKNNVQFSNASGVRSTADLPMQMVERLETIGSGRPFLIKERNGVSVATLHFLKEVPVGLDEARPQIQRFLMNRKDGDIAKTEVERLRRTAKIEYLDGTAGPAAASTAQAKRGSASDATTSGDAISKGVSALK